MDKILILITYFSRSQNIGCTEFASSGIKIFLIQPDPLETSMPNPITEPTYIISPDLNISAFS